MSLIFVGKMNVPTYTCLDADIIANAVAGATIVGGTIFVTDTAVWKIIKPDLTLAPYVLPVSITVDPGSINIGSVGVEQPVADAILVAPYYDTISVAVPGTAESLTATDVYAITITVWPKPTNVGTVYFGTAGVDKVTSNQIVLATTSGGASVDAPIGYKLNLKNFYIDAINANDGLNFMYLK